MIIAAEGIILCLVFTVMVYIMSREPVKTLYNYPPKIQERVKTLDEYKDKIPTQKNKITAKVAASLLIVIVLSVVLRYVNGCSAFAESFGYGLVVLHTLAFSYCLLLHLPYTLCPKPSFPTSISSPAAIQASTSSHNALGILSYRIVDPQK